jgi:hypothetical protein
MAIKDAEHIVKTCKAWRFQQSTSEGLARHRNLSRLPGCCSAGEWTSWTASHCPGQLQVCSCGSRVLHQVD